MKYKHHHLTYEIDDDWLTEARACGYTPTDKCYRVMAGCKDVFLVPIESVEPSIARAKLRGIFCDDRDNGQTARERVVRILRWFVANEEVEPVKVVRSASSDYDYKLVAGCHRFYCAHAVGFKKVPAVVGFDMNDLETGAEQGD